MSSVVVVVAVVVAVELLVVVKVVLSGQFREPAGSHEEKVLPWYHTQQYPLGQGVESEHPGAVVVAVEVLVEAVLPRHPGEPRGSHLENVWYHTQQYPIGQGMDSLHPSVVVDVVVVVAVAVAEFGQYSISSSEIHVSLKQQ